MRIFAILCLFITLSMSVIPMIAYQKDGEKSEPPEKVTTQEKITDDSASEENTTVNNYTGKKHTDEEISVYSSKEGKILKLSMRDYIIGVVAAEMPASYHIEALKAQALAALTYAVKTADDGTDSEELGGASLSTDSKVHQAYVSVDEMKKNWDDSFDENYEKIASAVDAVADKIVVYNNEPIVAVFHSISSGKTESAANIWGGDYPYLLPAESEGDTLSPKFSTTTMFTQKQFSKIAEGIEGVELGSDASKWIGKTNVSESGTVLSITIGGKKLSGTEVREYFSLRSPSFTLDYDNDGSFIFKVTGYGHGVGMSQYGADYMARQGASYDEIIKHYYSGVEIV